jgi:hypothetical protein
MSNNQTKKAVTRMIRNVAQKILYLKEIMCVEVKYIFKNSLRYENCNLPMKKI